MARSLGHSAFHMCSLSPRRAASRSLKSWACVSSRPSPAPPKAPCGGLAPTLTLQHASVGPLGHRIHVRWHLVALLAPVHLHDRLRVDGKLLVRVDDHAEKAGVRLRRAQAQGGPQPPAHGPAGPTGLLCTAGQGAHCTGTSAKGLPFAPQRR